jgi:hypothetical protein
MQTNTHARPVFTYTIGENENKLLFSLARRKIKAPKIYLKAFGLLEIFGLKISAPRA